MPQYLPANDLAGAMEMLAERGWEATEAVYGDRARVAKREWAAIAGRTYGVRVAADWRPEGWLADFDHMTPQIAEERVTNARDALNALHRVQAISESEQEAAERAATDLPGLEAHLAELTAERDRVRADRDAIPTMTAADRRNRLQNRIDEERRNLSAVHQCPHCAGHLAIRQGQIVIGEDSALVQSRIDEFVTQHDEADAELEKLTAADRPLIHQLQKLDASKSASESTLAQCRREAAKTGTVQTEADRAALAQSEQAVEDTREVVRLVKAEADATRLHETIVRYTEIARALGPEGVRAKMLEKGLRTLNSGLGVIASAAAWPITAIADNGGVSVGDRPVALCSESERWRAQAAIQLTLGAITGSKAVVLDRADLLDAQQPGRVGVRGQPGGVKDRHGGVAMQYGNAGGRRAVDANPGSGRGGGMMQLPPPLVWGLDRRIYTPYQMSEAAWFWLHIPQMPIRVSVMGPDMASYIRAIWDIDNETETASQPIVRQRFHGVIGGDNDES